MISLQSAGTKWNQQGDEMQKISQKPLPGLAAIQAEAARVEAMIAAMTQRIESSERDVKKALQLQVFRAELQGYLAGLLYSLGYTNLLDRQGSNEEFGLSESQVVSLESGSLGGTTDEDGLRFTECFEC
jgi:hypothetical protein